MSERRNNCFIEYHQRLRILLNVCIHALLFVPPLPLTADVVKCSDDPECSTQWHLGEDGTNWLNLYSRLTAASMSLRPVKVAIMDSGIQLDHPDFLPIDTEHSCGVIAQPFENLNCTLPEDEFGHGTLVAGQIMAQTDNLQFGAGAFPGLIKEPIIIKVMLPGGVANYSDISTGLEYLLSLLDQGIKIDVLTMSIAGDPLVQLSSTDYNLIDRIKEQLLELTQRGVTVVAGAGNDAGEPTHFPANQPSVIDVGFSTKNGQRAENSSAGEKLGASWQILAPGVDIGTTCMYHGFCYAGGSSLSTPQVAQAVAIIKSFQPEADLEEIQEILYAASTIVETTDGSELEFRILNFEKLADLLGIPELDEAWRLLLPGIYGGE